MEGRDEVLVVDSFPKSKLSAGYALRAYRKNLFALEEMVKKELQKRK